MTGRNNSSIRRNAIYGSFLASHFRCSAEKIINNRINKGSSSPVYLLKAAKPAHTPARYQYLPSCVLNTLYADHRHRIQKTPRGASGAAISPPRKNTGTSAVNKVILKADSAPESSPNQKYMMIKNRVMHNSAERCIENLLSPKSEAAAFIRYAISGGWS